MEELPPALVAPLALNEVPQPQRPAPPGRIPSELVAATVALMAAALSEETLRGYGVCWKVFQRWCHLMNIPPLPLCSEIVCYFLASMFGTHKATTIEKYLFALQHVHRLNTGSDESLLTYPMKLLLRGIKRTSGTAVHRKAAYTLALCQEIVALIDTHPRAERRERDASLFLTMIGGALRCSNAVLLKIPDVDFDTENSGMLLRLRRSKTDPFGHGHTIPISQGALPSTDPVARVKAWIDLMGRKTGPLFPRIFAEGSIGKEALTTRGVDSILRGLLKQLVPDPSKYGTHSPRVTFVTLGCEAGLDQAALRSVTLQASLETLYIYYRPESVLALDVTKKLGL